MIIIAKSCKGAEYLYSAATAHRVPKSSANKICETLNRINYKLKDGETWFIHEVSGYENAAIYADGQRFSIRKGNLYETR